VARATDLVGSSEPGDVIRGLLVAALSARLIDGALLPDLDRWTLEPVTRVATTVSEVVDAVGTPFLWSPVLSALNEAVYEQDLQNVAVVGTPCVSQALRKLGASANERLAPYQRAIRMNIAVFCAGVYRPELIRESTNGGMGINPRSIKRLYAFPRDNRLTATLWDGSSRVIPLSQVEKYTRQGCARCDDYLGDSADIAVGAVGAKPGYSTLVVRSQMGEILIHAAVDLGLLEVSEQVDREAVERVRQTKERRQRAQEMDHLMLMMLDALAEPKRTAEAKKAFLRLYDSQGQTCQRPPTSRESDCRSSCSQC
jgi:coenzyme F420 hydrogenase subunit beta